MWSVKNYIAALDWWIKLAYWCNEWTDQLEDYFIIDFLKINLATHHDNQMPVLAHIMSREFIIRLEIIFCLVSCCQHMASLIWLVTLTVWNHQAISIFLWRKIKEFIAFWQYKWHIYTDITDPEVHDIFCMRSQWGTKINFMKRRGGEKISSCVEFHPWLCLYKGEIFGQTLFFSFSVCLYFLGTIWISFLSWAFPWSKWVGATTPRIPGQFDQWACSLGICKVLKILGNHIAIG